MKHLMVLFLAIYILNGHICAQNLDLAPSIHMSMYDTEDPCQAGQNTQYVIEVRNEGDHPEFEIVLEDKIPSGMEFVSAQGPGNFKFSNGSVIFDPVPTLANGQMLEYKILCKTLKPGFTKNTVSLKTKHFKDPIIQEELTNIVDPSAGEKAPAIHFDNYDTEDPCYAGSLDEEMYIYSVRNEGSAPVRNIKIEDKIPASMEFLKAVGPGKYEFKDGKVIFDNEPVLMPGKVLTYRVICKALKPDLVKNTATLQTDLFDQKIIHEEATTIKTYRPFRDKGYLSLDIIEIGNTVQFVQDTREKGTFSIGGEIVFPLSYSIDIYNKIYLKIKGHLRENNQIEIVMEYYDNLFSPKESEKKLLLSKTLVIPEWQCIVILLEGQEKQYHKKYLRIIPRLEEEDIPRNIVDMALHLEKFYFLDMEKQTLLATGGVSGHIIGINVPDKGFFEFSLQRFDGARRLGIISNNEISIYSFDNWKKPGYKIVATNTIIGGGKYWIWFKQGKPVQNREISIEARSYQPQK